VRYVSDVVTRWRRHPPEIGITILLPNTNLFHQALLLVSGYFGTSPFCWQFFDKQTTLSPKSLTRIAPDQCVSSPECELHQPRHGPAALAHRELTKPCSAMKMNFRIQVELFFYITADPAC
jgi:hypothetical protein